VVYWDKARLLIRYEVRQASLHSPTCFISYDDQRAEWFQLFQMLWRYSTGARRLGDGNPIVSSLLMAVVSLTNGYAIWKIYRGVIFSICVFPRKIQTIAPLTSLHVVAGPPCIGGLKKPALTV